MALFKSQVVVMLIGALLVTRRRRLSGLVQLVQMNVGWADLLLAIQLTV